MFAGFCDLLLYEGNLKKSKELPKNGFFKIFNFDKNPHNKNFEDLQENYHNLIDFADIFEEKIEENKILIPMNFQTRLILLYF